MLSRLERLIADCLPLLNACLPLPKASLRLRTFQSEKRHENPRYKPLRPDYSPHIGEGVARSFAVVWWGIIPMAPPLGAAWLPRWAPGGLAACLSPLRAVVRGGRVCLAGRRLGF